MLNVFPTGSAMSSVFVSRSHISVYLLHSHMHMQKISLLLEHAMMCSNAQQKPVKNTAGLFSTWFMWKEMHQQCKCNLLICLYATEKVEDKYGFLSKNELKFQVDFSRPHSDSYDPWLL